MRPSAASVGAAIAATVGCCVADAALTAAAAAAAMPGMSWCSSDRFGETVGAAAVLDDCTVAAVHVMCSSLVPAFTELMNSRPVAALTSHTSEGSTLAASSPSCAGSTSGDGMETAARPSVPVLLLLCAARALSAAAAISTYPAPGNTTLPATWWSHRKDRSDELSCTSNAAEAAASGLVKLLSILLVGGTGKSLVFCQAVVAAIAGGVLAAGAMLLLEDCRMMCALVPVHQRDMMQRRCQYVITSIVECIKHMHLLCSTAPSMVPLLMQDLYSQQHPCSRKRSAVAIWISTTAGNSLSSSV
jgi:hypothetical protein